MKLPEYAGSESSEIVNSDPVLLSLLRVLRGCKSCWTTDSRSMLAFLKISQAGYSLPIGQDEAPVFLDIGLAA